MTKERMLKRDPLKKGASLYNSVLFGLHQADSVVSLILQNILSIAERILEHILDRAAFTKLRKEICNDGAKAEKQSAVELNDEEAIYPLGWQQHHAKGIRLLTIMPGSGAGPIRCTMKWEIMGSCPEYTAMSYCVSPSLNWLVVFLTCRLCACSLVVHAILGLQAF